MNPAGRGLHMARGHPRADLSGPDAPVAWVRFSDRIAGWVARDQLGLGVAAKNDRVLTKRTPEDDRLVAIDAVHQPGRFAPHTVRPIIDAQALFDAIATEHQQVSQDLMARLVDPP